MTSAAITGDLCLGHILAVTGLDLSDFAIIRHTYTDNGLRSPSDLTAEKVLDYTRTQGVNNKLGKTPQHLWVIFMADGGRRSRLLTAYENHGELPNERTETHRYFDLRPSRTGVPQPQARRGMVTRCRQLGQERGERLGVPGGRNCRP